jgi:hypothetical protein
MGSSRLQAPNLVGLWAGLEAASLVHRGLGLPEDQVATVPISARRGTGTVRKKVASTCSTFLRAIAGIPKRLR